MGGVPPLGYQVWDRRLVVVAAIADKARAPTDVQTEMSDDEGSGNGWSGARLTNATTAALVRTYRGTSFLPEDRRFKPLVLSLLRGNEGSNPCPSSEKSCQIVLPIPGVD